ncbi:undecaprenyl-phosphate alpha-N-acetylglucosaminyl 1-phosphate transferase [Pelobium manganitolerans]|uniref:Undecaprenyl-phosphate alpha-N-acetylglucosaminyl 1-phosphate transferase n=1 Tax=Pelobium manganitolerans TaxID=1842495 RepID=A0A419S6J0_9SPHI|nr:MraY family glycosyltransferase [Pelobium manganitolerans]RKD16649.1 undecaprenyl-phosphate alpha-N-acetylglucosaminyl 1-phosphate transferase [Pelobium manganitolerans]
MNFDFSFLEVEWIYYLVVIVVSSIVSFIAIPSIIFVARERHLFDDMESGRKDHDHGIPRLGGVAIFCSFTIVSLLFAKYDAILPTNILLTSCIILFAIGLKDDLAGSGPSTKFVMQFLVAIILVLLGDVRLTSLYGVFNVAEIPNFISIPVSVLIIMFVVNAFNLIDGINGLAGTIGLVVNLTFAVLFIHMGQIEMASLAFSMVGAIIGFLYYNYTPARIFMGDTGSLLVGLISVVLAIKFIELNKFTDNGIRPSFFSAPAIAVSVLIIPLFDTFRVFSIRILRGNSPFKADRNHIHHRILRLGFSHIQTTYALAFTNLLFIYLALNLRSWGNFVLIFLFMGICALINWLTTILLRIKDRGHFKIHFLYK